MPPNSPGDFEQWVLGVRPKLVRSASSVLKDRDEAENVVQATLAVVWQRYQAGEARDLDAYAARAVWANSLRLRGRRRFTESLEDEGIDEAVHAVASTDHPDEL